MLQDFLVPPQILLHLPVQVEALAGIFRSVFLQVGERVTNSCNPSIWSARILAEGLSWVVLLSFPLSHFFTQKAAYSPSPTFALHSDAAPFNPS